MDSQKQILTNKIKYNVRNNLFYHFLTFLLIRIELSGDVEENKITIWSGGNGPFYPISIIYFKDNTISKHHQKLNSFGKLILIIVAILIIWFYTYTFLHIVNIVWLIPWGICTFLFYIVFWLFRRYYLLEKKELEEYVKNIGNFKSQI